jgi:hypothetical protein
VVTFLLDILCDILSNTPVTKNYTTDLENAIRELLAMSSEKEQLETRIAKQKKRVAALYELVQTDEGSTALAGLVEGLTDACRVVFRAAEKPLAPSEVRDRVQALGLPRQANLLASVHTTIRRLEDAGEIREALDPTKPSGAMDAGYEWVGVANAFAEKMRSLTPLEVTRDAFVQAHKAKIEREKAKQPGALAQAAKRLAESRKKVDGN